MKTFLKYFHIILFATLTASTFAQNAGPHGGTIRKASDKYFIEVKVPEQHIIVYLLDEKFKTISNKGISGKMKIIFADKTVIDVKLRPTQDNGFDGGTVNDFFTCKISFNVFGKDVTANFENQRQIAVDQ